MKIESLSKDDGEEKENGKKAISLNRRNNNFARASRILHISLPSLHAYYYPGYQRFFLACDGELRFVGRRPMRVPPKAEDTSGEAARIKLFHGSLFKT